MHHILLKRLVDHQLTVSDDQFILFDNKSFLASPEADIESVHLVLGGWAAIQMHNVCYVVFFRRFRTFRLYQNGIFFFLLLFILIPSSSSVSNEKALINPLCTAQHQTAHRVEPRQPCFSVVTVMMSKV